MYKDRLKGIIMILNCKECGKPIPAIDINITSLMAKCVNCNSVFSFEDKSRVRIQNTAFDTKRAMVPMPKGINLNEKNGQLEIEVSWFRLSNIFLTFFTMLWDSFMFGWFYSAISNGEFLMVLFGSLHGAVGVYLTYRVLSGYVNKTLITVSRQSLSVKIGPLPWPGNISIPSSEMAQLYSKRVITQGKNSTTSYEVHGIRKNGTHLALVKSLERSEEAFYLEQKIEDFLQIEDEPVRGEISR